MVCPSIIASAKVLPLVWDWSPCVGQNCLSQIDGYHVYRASAPAGSSNNLELVDTQPDQNVTIRGVSPFSKTDCFVVRAFKGSQESASSNTWCGSASLQMGIATSEYVPVKRMSIDGTWGSACSSFAQWQVVEGGLSQGASLIANRAQNPCEQTRIWYPYLGFKIDVPGGVQKATLKTTFTPVCNIAGPIKILDTSLLFATETSAGAHSSLGRQTVQRAASGPQPIAPIPLDTASERDFDWVHSSSDSGSPTAEATADVTPWFSATKAGSYVFGVSFKNAETKEGCVTTFGYTSIVVTYYPN